MATRPTLIELAADPSLIPGIYNTCDQWCSYCPATNWCLAYRSGAASMEDVEMDKPIADRIQEGAQLLKQLSDAEGRPIPELDALLSHDPGARVALIEINDDLERLGRRYARLSYELLLERGYEPQRRHPPEGPTPLQVIAWYCMLIPSKIYRALYGAARIARGATGLDDDVLASAKVALIGIDRSAEALAALASDREKDGEDELPNVLAMQLRRLRREVEARFPTARAFRRPGLDEG